MVQQPFYTVGVQELARSEDDWSVFKFAGSCFVLTVGICAVSENYLGNVVMPAATSAAQC